MGKRVERTRAGGTWTEARYWSFIRSALRRAWTRYPVRYQALNNACRVVHGKRYKKEYQCAICLNWYKQKEVEVDHILPCGTLRDYGDLPGFVQRLFCEPEHLRVLCKQCHNAVTKAARSKNK